MREVFVDTFYWISSINAADPWHARVLAASRSLGPVRLVTTDEVVVEVLAFYSGAGRNLRRDAVLLAHDLRRLPDIHVLPQSRASFMSGLALYERRPDKGYSLTDCISMQTMRDRGITEVLTHDHHFTQEGFTILLP